MNIACVIGARGGSKGVKSKNIRPLVGVPLIGWSIEQAKSCPEINRVFVSTDCDNIARVSREFGAEVPFSRPKHLASDTAGKWDVWVHALKSYEEIFEEKLDLLVDLDCTSPLREPEDISNAIQLFNTSNVDAVFSICEARKNPYFNLVEEREGSLKISKSLEGPILRRQDAPQVFEHVASIYVLSPEYLRNGNGLLSGNVVGYDIGQEKSIDVDSEFDFKIMEFLMSERQHDRNKN